MDRGQLSLLLSLQWWGLWGGTCGQRPAWYKVGMEPAPGDATLQDQPPLETAAEAPGWAGLAYWPLALTLLLGALAVTILRPQWGHSPEESQVTARAEGHSPPGSSDVAMAEVLHLLEAMMEKLGRELRCLERQRPTQFCQDPRSQPGACNGSQLDGTPLLD